MADITIKGISCSHQSIATAGWRGPNPFKRWFGSILPALAKHCGSRCGRDTFQWKYTVALQQDKVSFKDIRGRGHAQVLLGNRTHYPVVSNSLRYSRSVSPCCIWPNVTHLPLHQQHQVHSISLTQLFPLLPWRQPIYPPCYLFKFYVAPSQRVRKIVPWEKDNNNLWQCTWVKCPEVMKQLQAVTDGPCCKLSAALVTETATRQM